MKSLDSSVLEFAKQSDAARSFFAARLGFIMSISMLKQKMDNNDEDFQVIDVRHKEVYGESRIPGALFVDADDLESHWSVFDKDKINIVYCYGDLCHRAAHVCLAASLKEIPVMELHGGFDGWEGYPMPISKE